MGLCERRLCHRNRLRLCGQRSGCAGRRRERECDRRLCHSDRKYGHGQWCLGNRNGRQRKRDWRFGHSSGCPLDRNRLSGDSPRSERNCRWRLCNCHRRIGHSQWHWRHGNGKPRNCEWLLGYFNGLHGQRDRRSGIGLWLLRDRERLFSDRNRRERRRQWHQRHGAWPERQCQWLRSHSHWRQFHCQRQLHAGLGLSRQCDRLQRHCAGHRLDRQRQ